MSTTTTTTPTKTLEQVAEHQCLSNCQCSHKTASSPVVTIEDKSPTMSLGQLISEDLKANGIENPLLSNKKKMPSMSEAEKISKIEG
jgi:hypothetical protein